MEVAGSDCFVCAGLMGKHLTMTRMTERKIGRWQFATFSVGVSMPPGVQEREDELRSELKLTGRETAKAQAARLISVEVARDLRKRIERGRPDLSVVVDFAAFNIEVSSRPLFYYARYAKSPGVSQRRELCPHCSGAGCEKCRLTGFEQKPSVEDALRKKLAKICGTDRMKFTWIGSEDRDSAVMAPGRPFVVELKSPKRLKVPRRFAMRVRGSTIVVSNGRRLPSKPTRLPTFRFKTRILGSVRSKVDPDRLADLRKVFRQATVGFDRPHDRPTSKVVHSVRARQKGRTLIIDADLDGGLPVKRLVSGELVSPSVSEVLKTEVRCRSFDICGVKETGKFGFAKVSWL